MSAAEIIRAFLQGKLPKRYVNTRTKQFYFYHIVRSIANLNRANTNTEMYWSYCTEAYYYWRMGNGSLQAAYERSIEESNNPKQTWWEQVGFERQAKRITSILDGIPAETSKKYVEMLDNNNE